MKEKIENINFKELTMDDANSLLNELLTYEGIDFKENIIAIIDTINFSQVNDDENISEPIEIIFKNDRVQEVMNTLLDEYGAVE